MVQLVVVGCVCRDRARQSWPVVLQAQVEMSRLRCRRSRPRSRRRGVAQVEPGDGWVLEMLLLASQL